MMMTMAVKSNGLCGVRCTQHFFFFLMIISLPTNRFTYFHVSLHISKHKDTRVPHRIYNVIKRYLFIEYIWHKILYIQWEKKKWFIFCCMCVILCGCISAMDDKFSFYIFFPISICVCSIATDWGVNKDIFETRFFFRVAKSKRASQRERDTMKLEKTTRESL